MPPPFEREGIVAARIAHAVRDWPTLAIEWTLSDPLPGTRVIPAWIHPHRPQVIRLDRRIWNDPNSIDPDSAHPGHIPRVAGVPMWDRPGRLPGDILCMEDLYGYMIDHEIGHVLHAWLRRQGKTPYPQSEPLDPLWLSEYAWERRDTPDEVAAECHAMLDRFQPERFPGFERTHETLRRYRRHLNALKGG